MLNDAVNEASKTNEGTHKHTRTQGEILEEILELTRGISRQVVKDDIDEIDVIKNSLLKYILLSRCKNDSSHINHLPWNDLIYLKGKGLKAGSKWSDLIVKALDKEKNKDDESDD